MTTDSELGIKEAFERAQKGHQNKAKLVAALKSTYNKLEDKSAFHEEFVHYLKYAMIVYKREPVVENVMDFVSRFATCFDIPGSNEEAAEEEEEEEEVDNPFLNYLFNFLLESHNANSHAVRFRACQLINKVLGSMAENAQIDDDLFDRIHETMLVRVTDKFPNVRIQAALAMARLQEPQNPDCPTIAAYILILENDSNPEVRRAVLSCIAPCAQTLPRILRRTRDVKENVRKLAYQVLAEKVHIRALSIAQRVSLLQRGLNDASAAVKEVVQRKLLPAWLKLLQGDVLELLHRLDVENSPDVAASALSSVFTLWTPEELLQDRVQLDGRKLIPVESLTCEKVLYWRALCQFAKSKGDEGEDMLEQLLPEAAVFAEYLYGYLQSIPVLTEEEKADFSKVELAMTKEFVGQELVTLVGCLDTEEEGGRKRVLAVLQEMLVLPNTPTALVALLVEKLVSLLKDDDRRIQVVAEIISDVREPIVPVTDPIDENETRRRQVRLAEVKVKIFEAKQSLEECIAAQEFSHASELKDTITELENLKNQLMRDAEQPDMKEVRVEKPPVYNSQGSSPEPSALSTSEMCVHNQESGIIERAANNDPENDPETLLKCLTMCSELLKQMSIKKGIGPTMNAILESLVLPGIASAHPAVRNMAVICLGTCALHSKDLANRHLVLLLQIAQLDEPKIRVSALKAVIDQLHLNGFDVVRETPPQPPARDSGSEDSGSEDGGRPAGGPTEEASQGPEGEGENTAQSVLRMLSEFLDSEISDLRTEAAEGLAKLMYSGRLCSAKLLSRLVLLWYNPVTEDDTRLRHCLGVFFQLYSRDSRAYQECLEESFLPTMQTLLNAPATSPLAEVDVSNVAELFIELTRPDALAHPSKDAGFQDVSVHDSLAVRLSNEILRDPSAPEVRLYARSLSTLQLSTEDSTAKKDVLLLLEEVRQEVSDKISLRAIEKVLCQLKVGPKDRSGVPQDNAGPEQALEETEGPEDGQTCEEHLTASKRPKRGQRKTTTAKVAKFSKGRESSGDSDGENVPEAPTPVARPSRRAKSTALQRTKMDLTALINQEVDGSE
ncbi:condensin complex subunit 3 isoform X2 [Anguilla anguilla]|uniref:condensin complex subunit 3 isoform X2 n=1 Tax=Anguilla anguilla TaxID=7936 RepID=UPI0015AC68DD|nr:condensin complex subunit 3 isoform X2 [Anguilla anguilla]XP_035272904.1 condensin complex subunit 3 isoform X2 [Anguilla anguilla]XP_035272905.1 condensin complex subunit 3 isoform X2 [Anguilla anguilla]